MTQKVDVKKQIEVFHTAGDYLGCRGISVLVLTGLGKDVVISEAGFTYEEAIHLIRHLADRHPQELNMALTVAQEEEREEHQSTRVY